jgi:long-chain fatty acid transport protein
MTVSRHFIGVMTCASAVLAAEPARSSGYFIDQQSVPGLGRCNAANVAAAYDPSTIFFNPAGLTELWNGEPSSDTRKASVGLSVIIPNSEIRNSGSTTATPGSLGLQVPSKGQDQTNPTQPTPVGNIYLAQRLPNSRFYFGLGLTSPFGLSAKYDEDWFGRYDSTETKLLTINIGPTVAYKVSEQLSVGGGVDFQYAYAELTSAIPNPLVPGGPTPATDARFYVDGNSFAVGYNVGLLYRPTRAIRIGAHYRSGVSHDLSGTALFQGFVGNFHTGASSELNLPAIASAGAVFDLTASWSLFSDVTWYDWSVARVTRIQFTDATPDAIRPAHYDDTYTVALGLENRLSDTLTLRGGIKYDPTPTNDAFRDTTFADADRLWLAVGATYKVDNSLTADFAFTHVFEKSTSINIDRTFFDGTPLATSTSIAAHVQSFVDTLAVNLRYTF